MCLVWQRFLEPSEWCWISIVTSGSNKFSEMRLSARIKCFRYLVYAYIVLISVSCCRPREGNVIIFFWNGVDAIQTSWHSGVDRRKILVISDFAKKWPEEDICRVKWPNSAIYNKMWWSKSKPNILVRFYPVVNLVFHSSLIDTTIITQDKWFQCKSLPVM